MIGGDGDGDGGGGDGVLKGCSDRGLRPFFDVPPNASSEWSSRDFFGRPP